MLRTTCLYMLGALIIMLLNACNNESKPEKTQPTKATPLYQAMSAAQTGIDYKSDYQEDPRDPTGLLHGGASVAAGDINNDGLTDLLFTGGWLNSGLYLNQED